MITESGSDSSSHAVLIGVSAYEDDAFPSIQAARHSVSAMRDVLTDPALCGWRPEQVTIILNPHTVQNLAIQLAEIARHTIGVLLVYYVGHGVLSDQGELCLTTTTTIRDYAKISGLRWSTIAEDLHNSPAGVRIAILDCCFAGQAIEALSANELGLADITHVQGAYTLTATTRNHTAHVPPANRHDVVLTSFTGEFVDLIRNGIPGKPVQLTLGDLYPILRQRLRSKGLPLPNQRGTDTVQQLQFTYNAAATGAEPLSAPSTPPPLPSTKPTRPRRRWRRWAAVTAACAVVVLTSVIVTFALRPSGGTPPSARSGTGSSRVSGAGATYIYSGALPSSGDVTDVAFSHDGTMVAAAEGNDHAVTLWNANTGKQLRIMSSCCVVSSVSFSPDDSRLTTDSDLFDTKTGDHLHEFTGSGYSVAFSPNGSFIAVASGYDPNQGTQLFDPSTGQPIRLLSNEYASDVAVSPDSKTVASATGYLDKGIRLWRASDGHLIRTLAGGSDRVAFSHDGNFIATSGNGSIQVWNATTGAHIRDINAAQVLLFSSNGSLFTTDANGAVYVYNPNSGSKICSLDGVYASKAALSSDGRRIVAVAPNKTVVLTTVSQNCLPT